ncbi:MAG TPA: hypothetical protein VMY06_10355 [Sedimentisphaerales bacterium]|nr:hypothetical protein [Sedimentisphaerales bacterium]
MANRIFVLVAVVTILCLCVESAIGIHVIEMEICTDSSTQANPDIEYNFIVWQDNRNGNWDIYGYDLDKGMEYAICTADGNQTNPSLGIASILNEPIIAWQDDRNGNNDIYGYKLLYNYYDLAIGTEIEICTDPCEQQNPVSVGEYVFWQDNRNGDWDIYARTYEYQQEPNEVVICDEAGDQINPAAQWDTIAWQDNRSGDWDIYGLDMDANNEEPICTKDGNQTNPSCSRHGFAWQDDRNGNNDIYAAFYRVFISDLNDLVEVPVCTDSNSQIHPGFCEEIIVWQDDRNGGWDIYGYRMDDIYFGTEFDISTGTGDRIKPAVHDYTVVWQDMRNGNDDIYVGYPCLRGNDECGGCAIEVFDDEPYFGTTLGMSPTYIDTPTGQELLTSTCGFNDYADVWHIYQPAMGGPVTITTEGSSLDTILSVFNSCFGLYSPHDPEPQPPIELACNDDYCLENAGSKVSLDAVKGKTYYIRVSGFNDQRGDYRIVVKRGAATDPIKSDLNGNGKVDWYDFAIFASEWLMSNTQ